MISIGFAHVVNIFVTQYEHNFDELNFHRNYADWDVDSAWFAVYLTVLFLCDSPLISASLNNCEKTCRWYDADYIIFSMSFQNDCIYIYIIYIIIYYI